MGKFLTTAGVASAIEDIIRKSSAYFVIVTPYLKLSKAIELRLKDANNRKIQMTLIYGKTELFPEQMEKLKQLQHLDLYYCDNLHAKCYHNEHSLVISSMNLHEYSEKNNIEMGVLLDKEQDKEVFEEALLEIESIKNASMLLKTRVFAPKLMESHPNENDFHLPLLFRILEEEYKELEFVLEETMIKACLPDKSRLEIDNRVVIRFDNLETWKVFKAKFEKKSTVQERCFWNPKTLHRYLPTKFTVEVSEDGQQQISEYQMSFIREALKFI